MPKLAILGECMLEVSGKLFESAQLAYGGDSLNTATYLARITSRDDLTLYYVTVVGEDAISHQIKQCWQQEGINTDLVLHDPQRTMGIYLIEIDPHGERSFTHWRHHSAARYLLQHPNYPEVQAKLAECEMLYLSGISLAILPEADRFALLEQLKMLSDQGVKIIFDNNYRPSLWESREQALQIYQQIYPLVHCAILTEDDEKLLWQLENRAEIYQQLRPFNIPHLILKSGSEGAYYLPANASSEHPIPTTPITNIVDTTAAGDSFNAGFLAGFIIGKSIIECCQQGNQLAGIVIQHRGAIIPPSATAHLQKLFR